MSNRTSHHDIPSSSTRFTATVDVTGGTTTDTARRSKTNNVTTILPRCRYGNKCRNQKLCRFQHPPIEADSQTRTVSNKMDYRYSSDNRQKHKIVRNRAKKVNCRFGSSCTRSNCHFVHPNEKMASTSTSTSTSSSLQSQKPATTTTSYEIGNETEKSDLMQYSSSVTPSFYSVDDKNDKSDVTKNLLSTSTKLRFCSLQEFQERQTMKQVSILEATPETASLPQAQRQLDPYLAIAKYRRSAAGSTHTYIHSVETLKALLRHFIDLASLLRPTPLHPSLTEILKEGKRTKVEVGIRRRAENIRSHSNRRPTAAITSNTEWQNVWTEFMVDRCRACQADAIRRQDDGNVSQQEHSNVYQNERQRRLPLIWHVQMTRLLIWIRYWMPWDDVFLGKTTDSMLATAIDQYWSSKASTSVGANVHLNTYDQYDDEILCYMTLRKVVKGEISSLQVDYQKYKTLTNSHNNDDDTMSNQRLRMIALEVAVSVDRQEYFVILHNKSLPILARCIVAPLLPEFRYRQCQQYNMSFAKEEAVYDLPRLLAMDIGRNKNDSGVEEGSGKLEEEEEDDDSRLYTFSVEHINKWIGLPCRRVTHDEITQKPNVAKASATVAVFKKVTLSDELPFSTPYKDHHWVFQDSFRLLSSADNNVKTNNITSISAGVHSNQYPMKLSGDQIRAMLSVHTEA